MQIIEDVAHVLHLSKEKLEIESLRTFLEKELRNIEAGMYRIGRLFNFFWLTEIILKLGSKTD